MMKGMESAFTDISSFPVHPYEVLSYYREILNLLHTVIIYILRSIFTTWTFMGAFFKFKVEEHLSISVFNFFNIDIFNFDQICYII